jgi:hypothetical protein
VSGSTGGVTVNVGTEASFKVYLTPNLESGGTGILSYNISFPSTVSRAFLGLYPMDVSGTTTDPAASREIEIDVSTGAALDTLSGLLQGSYRAAIDLYDGTNNKVAVWTGAVHIHKDAATTLNRIFTADIFA